jgi:hypothetical protein
VKQQTVPRRIHKILRSDCDFIFSFTSSNDSNMSILGWWIVQTIVRPVLTIFRTVLITMAADLASNPDVGSSMKTIEGFATSSTAIANHLRCSVDRPFTPCRPTRAPLKGLSSTRSITSSTKAYAGSTKDKKTRGVCYTKIKFKKHSVKAYPLSVCVNMRRQPKAC